VLVRLNQARNPEVGAAATEYLQYDYDYAVHRRNHLDRAFNQSQADRDEEKRLTQQLAAINKELASVQKQVKTRYGLEEDKVFSTDHELEVSKIAQLPSYMYVFGSACCYLIRNTLW